MTSEHANVVVHQEQWIAGGSHERFEKHLRCRPVLFVHLCDIVPVILPSRDDG